MKKWQQLGVTNYEMETAAVFVTAQALGLKAASLCGVVAKRTESESIASPEIYRLAEHRFQTIVRRAFERTFGKGVRIMKRAIILMMDSFGIGGAEDAARFGDQGADTLGHIAGWFAREKAKDPSRHLLHLPNLAKLGLGLASRMSTGHVLTPSIGSSGPLKGAYSYAREVSSGKDTLSGHWELTGVPVMFDWGYFPDKPHCFPENIIQGLIKEGNLPGVLGEKHASGTVIIQELGEEHMKTGKPIVYTSADSVLQIAAHERTFGLERLYQLCEIAYRLVQPYHIARVIARPFVGEKPENSPAPATGMIMPCLAPEPTLLDAVYEKADGVYAIGKIADIFAHRGHYESLACHRAGRPVRCHPGSHGGSQATGAWSSPTSWISIPPTVIAGMWKVMARDSCSLTGGCRN